MLITDSYLLSLIFIIIALIYVLEVFKPFLGDMIMKVKSKNPGTYRPKTTGRHWIRIAGIVMGIIFAFVVPLPYFAQTIIVGILLAAIADGSYAAILKQVKLQFENPDATKTVTVPQSATVIQPAVGVQEPKISTDTSTRSERGVD